jgi:hypothetical protein
MRKKYWFLLVLAAIGAIGLGVYGIKKWQSNRPMILTESERIPVTEAERPELVGADGNTRGFSPEDIKAGLDYMLTDEYANLSEEEKQRYREQLADSYNASIPELGFFRGSDLLEPTDEKYSEGQREYLQQEVARVHHIADERAGDQGMPHGGNEFLDNFLAMNREEQNAMLDEWIDWMDNNRTLINLRRRSHPRPAPATDYPTRFQRRMSYQDPLQRAKFGELMNRFEQRCEERNIRPVRMF